MAIGSIGVPNRPAHAWCELQHPPHPSPEKKRNTRKTHHQHQHQHTPLQSKPMPHAHHNKLYARSPWYPFTITRQHVNVQSQLTVNFHVYRIYVYIFQHEKFIVSICPTTRAREGGEGIIATNISPDAAGDSSKSPPNGPNGDQITPSLPTPSPHCWMTRHKTNL